MVWEKAKENTITIMEAIMKALGRMAKWMVKIINRKNNLRN